MKKLLTLFCVLSLIACNVSDTQEEFKTTTRYDLNNPTVQEIFDLQDKKNSTELAIFFNHIDPQYRYIAAMAFASIKDTTDTKNIRELAGLLEDEDEAVRYAAIYALGQLRHPMVVEHLQSAFKNDKATASNRINAQVLEGIGKSASAEYLQFLVRPKKYSPKDTLLLEGQCYGIYRFALRGITDVEGTKKMIAYSSNSQYPRSVRRIAANYLARAKKIDLTEYIGNIVEAIGTEQDPMTRMALVLSLGKVEDVAAVNSALATQFSREQDYRVKSNILRIMNQKEFEYLDTRALFLDALKDGNKQIRTQAAEHFRKNGKRSDVNLYLSFAKDSTLTDKILKINYLGAALGFISYTRSGTRSKINEELISIYQASKNPYEKGLVLECLAAFPVNYKFLWEEAKKKDNHAYVRSSGMQGLLTIRRNPKLAPTFGFDYAIVDRDFNNYFKEAIASDDPALIGITAELLRDEKFYFREIYDYDYRFLLDAQQGLKLPRHIETYNSLQKTIDFFAKKETPTLPKVPKYNHPIDWTVMAEIQDETFARIQTAKGEIIVQFFARAAPGSVSNFIKLANDGFYDGKNFHRIVRNFVAQGGGTRGDGWGSLDYSIRSELNDLKYDDEGYLGMASAGPDTESTQWFITHSPAPHLDGNYTIFGKVLEGMEVVHQLEVGDVMKKVTIETPVEGVE